MEELLKDLGNKNKILLESLKQEFSGLRSNRPTPQLVEDIQVDYLGQMLKVKQLGSISVVPPREIQISVWDKNAVASLAKAIQDSSIKLNPSVDGKTVHLRMPPLTQERREELIKVVKGAAEKSKIKIRNFRDEANKRIVEAEVLKKINEDQKFKLKKQVQETTDGVNKEIEDLLNGKIKEISE